jgi:carbon starvation protein
MGQMQQIVFNDYVDATLCVLFMLVVLSILVYGIRACVAARRSHFPSTVESGGTARPSGLRQGAGA